MKNISKKALICIICAIIFFIVTMPFRKFFMLMSTTEVRPASALPPVCGLFFGLPGAVGCAIGNFIADIVSGYNLKIIIPSFFVQVIYGYLPYVLWNRLKKNSNSLYIAFDTVLNVIKFVIIMFINSAICAVVLGTCIQLFDGGKLFSNMTLVIFFNNFDFSLLLGMPIINLHRRISFDKNKLKSPKINHNLSLNEKMITRFMITGIILSVFVSTIGYLSLLKHNMEWIKMWNIIYIYTAIILNIFFCGVILFLRYIEKSITIPIKSISDIAANYVMQKKETLSSENTLKECRKFEYDKTEIGVMARSLEKMISDLDVYMHNIKKDAAERERIAVELNIATKIQKGLLPKDNPDILNSKLIDLYGTMTPAKEVGGDFYDFFKVDNNHIAVIIGDVSGKGIPAAMFMAITKILIQLYIKEGKTLAETFTMVNNNLCEGNEADMFVTAFAGILDLSNGKLKYVNAGHNPPLIKRQNEKCEFLKLKPGFVLASIEDFKYKEFEIQLEKGEILFLYTDGVTEAINNKNELFGDERLKRCFDEKSTESIKSTIENIKCKINCFADGLEQFDDITMLALKINEYNKEIDKNDN